MNDRKVRTANLSDLPMIEEFGLKFHQQSKQPFPIDTAATRDFAINLIENDSATILISETGMIGGVLTPAYCAPQWIMAVELFWWADGGGLKLLRAFENWAEQSGAKEVRMTSLATLERADGLLRRLAYTPTEISYRRLL